MSNILKRVFFSTFVLNLVAFVVVAVLLLVALWYWMGAFTHHGESVNVPNVKNMLVNDASYALGNAGLVAVVQDSAYNRSLPAGCVLEQLPAPGSRVKEGREIYLTVNNREVPTLAIPDIADNCSLREAEAKLKALGFKLGPTEYVPGDRDWVLDVKCRGVHVGVGERIPIDVPVVLVVGNDASDLDDDFDADSLGFDFTNEPLTVDEL